MYQNMNKQTNCYLPILKPNRDLGHSQFNLFFHGQNQINCTVSWSTKIKQKITNIVFRNSESAVLSMIPGVVSMLSFYF